MKFSNNDYAVIKNTGTKLDDLKVQIVGVACQYEQMAVYIIQRTDPFTFDTGWSCIPINEQCLEPICKWDVYND